MRDRVQKTWARWMRTKASDPGKLLFFASPPAKCPEVIVIVENGADFDAACLFLRQAAAQLEGYKCDQAALVSAIEEQARAN